MAKVTSPPAMLKGSAQLGNHGASLSCHWARSRGLTAPEGSTNPMCCPHRSGRVSSELTAGQSGGAGTGLGGPSWAV